MYIFFSFSNNRFLIMNITSCFLRSVLISAALATSLHAMSFEEMEALRSEKVGSQSSSSSSSSLFISHADFREPSVLRPLLSSSF